MVKAYRGNRPEHIVKSTLSRDELDILAQKGAIRAFSGFRLRLYYFQAVIYGLLTSDEQRHRLLLIITPSRYGKSMVFSAAAIDLASEGKEVKVGGATKDKASIILGKTSLLLKDGAKEITDGLVEAGTSLEKLSQQVSKSGLKWSGGGSLQTFSFSESKKTTDVKGEGAIGLGGDVQMYDESPLISDDNYIVGKRFMQESSQTKLAEIGNPIRRNHFFQSYNDPNYVVIHIDDTTAIQEGRMRQEDFDLVGYTPGSLEHKVYVKCEFPEDSELDKFFTHMPIIEEIEPEVGDDVYMGVDGAYTGADDLVCSLVAFNRSKLKVKLIEMVSLKKKFGNPRNDDEAVSKSVDYMHELLVSFKIKSIAIDYGFGIHLYEVWKQRFPDDIARVHLVNFSSSPTKGRNTHSALHSKNKRAEMYLDMQDITIKGMFYCCQSDYDKIRDELNAIPSPEYEVTKISIAKKDIIKQALGGRSPDNLDSIVLAIHAITLYKTLPQDGRQPTIV